ncbi:beta transducin [Mycoemilia scoparia]|uniref:Beta transducin n=1 Tax=Mycoemilia scoparia TaxID=417184 RepID=A0A9W8DN39_9FUNG|nr:beta transducin [Mycoemilia scoparia]
MVKAYLRYEPKSNFGVISSPTSNLVYDSEGRFAIAPALSEVIVWDIKKGIQVIRWHDTDTKSLVTCISRSPNKHDFAVGYDDGSIRIFNTENQTTNVIFNGHRRAVTALTFDKSGMILASGSKDTDLILWDVVGEVGLFRLRGHKDEITGIAFVPKKPLNTAEKNDGNNNLENSPKSDNEMDESEGDDDDDDDGLMTSGAAESSGYIITSSKDTLVKIWDLQSRHCVQTLVTHRSEVWSFAVSPDSRLLVTGSSESSLKVWKLNLNPSTTPTTTTTNKTNGNRNGDSVIKVGNDEEAVVVEADGLGLPSIATEYGELTRQSKERIQQLKFHPRGVFLASANSDKTVEFWRIRDHDEIRKKMARRLKRQREKTKKQKNKKKSKAQSDDEDNDSDSNDEESSSQLPKSAEDMEIKATDELTPYQIIRTRAKVKSIDFNPLESNKTLHDRQNYSKLLVSLLDNTIEVYNVFSPPKGSSKKNPPQEPQSSLILDRLGHRSEARAIVLSNDNELIATASNGSLRIWNALTNNCLRTLECGQAVCATFLPGDQYVLVGTKKGKLQLFDIPSSTLVEEYDAHDGPCWSMHVQFDKKCVVTGGGDKLVKFWDFELVSSTTAKDGDEESNNGTTTGGGGGGIIRRRLTLVHSRSLMMSDVVLCVRFSPNLKLLAVSLLDTTVKVFYVDTLKFFLSLYGHKLPVLSMDISSDSTLLVTGSADKNIKIWGLDFGDCHKSLFEHQDAVTSIKFVWDTHYFFSASKDRMVQQFDADKFIKIQRLEGSHGEIWDMALGKHGNFVVTCSQDRSVRVWEKTEEPLFLEEEKERELEEMYEKGLAGNLDNAGTQNRKLRENGGGDSDGGDLSDNDDGSDDELGMAGKQTMETLKAGEKVMEALDLADEELEKWSDYHRNVARGMHVAPPPKNPMLIAMGNIDPEKHVLKTIESIRSSDLDDALLVLPFPKVSSLLNYIEIWAQKEWNIQLVCRILFFLLKTHQSQIVSTRTMRTRLDSIRLHLRSALQAQKDFIGFNMAALKSLRNEWEEKATANFFEEEKIQQVLDKATAKRKFY